MTPPPPGTKLVKVNDHGRPLGETHHFAVLSDADVGLVMDLLDAGLSYAVVAVKMDVSKSCIAHIATGRRRCQTVSEVRLVPVVSEVPPSAKKIRSKSTAPPPPAPVNDAAVRLQQALTTWR